MNILITGAQGFLGKEITEYFAHSDHKIFATNRQSLNVLNERKLSNYIQDNKIEAVIHTAVSGCGRSTDTYEDFCNNILMFHNLLSQRTKFKIMINFGSGAEFDRRSSISNRREEEVLTSCPVDYYGLAKSMITKEILKVNDNIYNFRIFGCFGKYENETRFISKSINRSLIGSPISITQNRLMDFIYVEDLCKLVEHYLNNFIDKDLYRDVNVCYNKKYDLKGISKKILSSMGIPIDKNIQYEKKGFFRAYTGDSKRFDSFNLDLVGLDNGIKKVINER
jgi:nucleoside-diphosphate-sugar epimerase